MEFARNTERMLAFDCETTGLDPTKERILTAALVKVAGDEYVPTTYRLKPDIPIPPDSTRIHGIVDSEAAKWDDPAVEVPKIIAEIYLAWENDIPLVGHNLPFDLNMLYETALRLGLEFKVTGPCLDSMVMQRMLGLTKASLSATASYYGYEQTLPHGAADDATVSAKCMRRILASPLGDFDYGTLYTGQRKFHRSWNQEKEAQFKSWGKAFDSSEWPIDDHA